NLLDAESGRRLVLDNEALDLVIGEISRPDDGNIAPGRVADPPLLAIEDPGVALALRRGQQATGRARTHEWLSEAETADLLEARHWRQPLLLLLFRSVDIDGTHRQADVHADERRKRRVDAGDLHLHKTQQRQASPRAAVAVHCKSANAQFLHRRQ